MSHTHRPRRPIPKPDPDNPNTVSYCSIRRKDMPLVLPDDATPIDDCLADLCSLDPESNEVIVNAMLILRKSRCAEAFLQGMGEKIVAESARLSAGGNTEEEDLALAKSISSSHRLIMTMGMLIGTGVGFAVGLQYEDDDDDEDGPDYEGPVM